MKKNNLPRITPHQRTALMWLKGGEWWINPHPHQASERTYRSLEKMGLITPDRKLTALGEAYFIDE